MATKETTDDKNMRLAGFKKCSGGTGLDEVTHPTLYYNIKQSAFEYSHGQPQCPACYFSTFITG